MENNSMTYAYAAGLIDGEGTITLQKSGKNSKVRHACVSASSTTEELLTFLKNTFGGTVSKRKPRGAYKNHSQDYSWSIKNRVAVSCIEKIAPFLREPEKQRRATLILNRYFVEVGGCYTPEQLKEKLAFEKEFFKNSVKVKLE
jgi:hypothetical protein